MASRRRTAPPDFSNSSMAASFFLLLIFFLSVDATSNSSQLLEFTYHGFTKSNSNSGNDIILGRAAAIDSTSGILRLTNETSRLIGRAFYPKLISFSQIPSFSTVFAFGIVPEYPKLGGHGLAFVLSPSTTLPGAQPSQYLGLTNASSEGNATNHFLAVEFDTVQDFEFGDPDDNHVGIDINSLQSAATASPLNSAAIGLPGINLKSSKTILAWIDFDANSSVLSVHLSLTSSKPAKPIISLPVNISAIVLDSMYVGFTSSTGLLASSHYLFGWSFKLNGEAPPLDLSKLPSLPNPNSEAIRRTRNLAIGSAAAASFLVVAGLLAAGIVVWKIKYGEDALEDWELDCGGPHRFSYRELAFATRGFSDKMLLGAGGFGRVYRGILPGTKAEIAVKRVSHESKQGLPEFVAEISSIGRLRHRNLVQLQGWCRRRGELLLVYDFMPNGSLDRFIFSGMSAETDSVLSWVNRFRVLRGVASALLYLHEEWEQVVLHRDVKASNVLLDSEFNGRLGDFGLARLYEHGENPSTTRVVGTLGYLAPETTRTGKATTRSDVFSYGALLLEVACGRRPIETKASLEELCLVDWVWACADQGRILAATDPRLQGEFDPQEMELVLRLGLMCSLPDPGLRPSMRQVMQYLDGDAPLPYFDLTNGPPVDYAARAECFDDFVHSYPSSVGKETIGSGLGAEQPAPMTSPISILSSRESFHSRE